MPNINLPSNIGAYSATDPTRLGWESTLWGQQPTGNYRGTEYDYLTSQLKDTIGGKLDPALMQLLGAGKRNISQFGDDSRRNIRQDLAGSGFRGSGANLMNNVFQSQSGAMGDLTANVGQMGMQNRQNAIAQLLGLNQFGGSQDMAEKGMYMGQSNFLRDLMQGGQLQREQMDANKPDIWGTIAGGIASAAPYAAIALSDKKLKENIKKTGEKTKDGIPVVEFNYKGDTQKYRGVLAQDVEKKRPSAVVKAVDYSKI